MTTIELEDGKYAFVIDDRGILIEARRNGAPWEAGLEFGYQKAFMAALYRIAELEDRPV